MSVLRSIRLSSVMLLAACSSLSGAPPKGADDVPEAEEAAIMKEVGQKADGIIVWSSSRVGNHDLFSMKTDGSEVKQITKGDEVDWFPRFSPDGSQLLFCRSKKGWVSERDANSSDKWDLFTINADGSEPKKVVSDASWGSWISQDEILYVRGTKIFRSKLGGEEVQIMDSEGVDELDGSLLQQPELSSDGKYIAITLRGSKRETGIWDIEKKTWTQTGLGCQVNWTPDHSSIYWVHPTGNGGSRILKMPIADGVPPKDPSEDDLVLMDLPGRRSHEYFPELSADGKWMVWGITQRGHDHDIADYEIYLWEVGTPPEKAARLTFNSGNDRWPDIFLPSAAPPKAEEKPAESASEEEEKPAEPSEPKAGKTKKSKKAKKGKP
jgi:Tol biopolymer transport system component